MLRPMGAMTAMRPLLAGTRSIPSPSRSSDRGSVRPGLRLFASSSQEANQKKVIVCIADGSEEIETSGIFDTLIRGGVHATLAKIGGNGLECKMSRGMTFVADEHFDGSASADMIVLPGGLPGAEAFSQCPDLIEALKRRKENKEWFAAICASPAVVLEPNGLLPGKATCFPGLQSRIAPVLENDPASARVVVDEASRCVTSQGPGTTLEFAVELLRILVGGEKAQEVAKGLLISTAE